MYKNERRIFDRFNVNFFGEIKPPDRAQGRSAQCCDVSANGVCLLTEEKLMPNANLEISLKIPDGHPAFCGLARVVWSKQVQQGRWRSGLELKTIDFMGIRRIFAILTQRA